MIDLLRELLFCPDHGLLRWGMYLIPTLTATITWVRTRRRR